MKEKLYQYFDWCNKYRNYLEIEQSKIEQYKQLTEEYYTDMRISEEKTI